MNTDHLANLNHDEGPVASHPNKKIRVFTHKRGRGSEIFAHSGGTLLLQILDPRLGCIRLRGHLQTDFSTLNVIMTLSVDPPLPPY